MLTKIKDWYDKLPEQKKRLDFITAFLTIPLLITLIISNILNVRSKSNESKESEKEQQPTTIVITSAPPNTSANGMTIIPIEITKEVQTTPGPECKKDIGPIAISYPSENQTVSDDLVCIDISYEQGDFCSVVWSYRINQSTWSDFTNKQVCFNKLPAGKIKFELRVKSVVSVKEKLLERNFTVRRELIVSPTPFLSITPSISPSISPI